MTPAIELLVTDWFRRVRESQRLHYECATYYSRLNYVLGVPTIVLTAGVGTAVFASFDESAAGPLKILLGLISILAAVLSSLQTFMGFGQRADRNRFVGSRYGALRRSLEFIKTFPPRTDEDAQREIEKIKREMDDLAQNAPHMPSWLKRKIDDELKSRAHRRVFNLQGNQDGTTLIPRAASDQCVRRWLFLFLLVCGYVIYQSDYLACSPGKSLNCYFAMPYKKSARFTVTNEGKDDVGAFYSNIDYQTVPSLPNDVLYFHAQYRQSAPCVPVPSQGPKINLDGKLNYVYAETRGRGHLMGVTLGVLQNADGWWGEGDEMIFVDDETKPIITGTGSEDYFLGSWDFGGRDNAEPFGHRQYGAPLIAAAERTGGRYCCYRWHGDNPVTFQRYMKHTMEHGHANDRGDNFFSACYWYQTEPYTNFPALPPVADRVPRVKTPS